MSAGDQVVDATVAGLVVNGLRHVHQAQSKTQIVWVDWRVGWQPDVGQESWAGLGGVGHGTWGGTWPKEATGHIVRWEDW